VSSSVFHIELLKNYQVIDRPGTFLVSVAHDITENNLYLEDDHPRYLISLRVIRAEELPNLVKYLKREGTVPFIFVRKYFLTGAIFDNGDIAIEDLPIKGEKVLATFDYVKETLQCTHIKLIDRDDLKYVNLSAIDDLYSLVEIFLSKDND